jgi:hypothetical protein
MCGDYIVTAAGGFFGGRVRDVSVKASRSQMRLCAPASGRRPFVALNNELGVKSRFAGWREAGAIWLLRWLAQGYASDRNGIVT